MSNTIWADGKVPVIICITNATSGVTSWALFLRQALKNHPKYQILLANMWLSFKSDLFDLHLKTVDEAISVFEELESPIILPNFNWELLTTPSSPHFRWVGMCHADSEEEYYRPIEQYNLLFSKIIAVSPVCTAALNTRLPHRQNDIETFIPSVALPKRVVRTYQTEPIRLIYGGRIVEKQKRVFNLVKLAHALEAKGTYFVLNIVGDGEDKDQLEANFQVLADPTRVKFWGRLPASEMKKQWVNNDIFLQVSDFEGTSISLIEAIAYGCVPAVTDTESGVRYIIEDGKNGLISPIGDMEKMAVAISNLAFDQNKLKKMGKASRKNSKRFSIEAYADQFVTLLDQIATDLDLMHQINQYKAIVQGLEIKFDKSNANLEQQIQEAKHAREEGERVAAKNIDLKAQVIDNAKRISELEDQLNKKVDQIDELEEKVLNQKTFIETVSDQRQTKVEALKTERDQQIHKTHQMYLEINKKDQQINWLNQEIKKLNNSWSLKLGRKFYSIRRLFERLVKGKNK